MRSLAALAVGQRRRSRPVARHTPAVRRKHIRAAVDVLWRKLSLREAGRIHGVCASTISRWITYALVGSEPEVEILRVLAATAGYDVPPMPS